MIIATAGHVDHGKTSLVRALTGIDTDRLKEEKLRGMSIEPGFAYADLGNGFPIGFVDVPGHERFVRNMLAGVAAVDFVLLVVAADDGPMPQTMEHLAILELLGVRHGAVVLTKIDRVSPARVIEARAEISAVLRSPALSNAPLFPVAANIGLGLDDLRRHLATTASVWQRRSVCGNFRLAVDRCFSLTGAGLVVTGAVSSGAVRIGDELLVAPHGIPVRVRSIHVHNAVAETAEAGWRCALNIAGSDLKRVSIERGDWIVAPAAFAPTERFDARVTVLASKEKSLAHWTPVHLHCGAAAVNAHVALLDGQAIAPGANALVQIVTDQPVGALRGDRFILRDQSAQQTIAGGMVVDPFGNTRGRSKPARLAQLDVMERSTPDEALAGLLQMQPEGVHLANFTVAWNMTALESDALLHRHGPIVFTDAGQSFGIAPTHWHSMRDQLLNSVGNQHTAQPDSLGSTEMDLAAGLGMRVLSSAWRAVVKACCDDGMLIRDGICLRLPSHRPQLSNDDAALLERVTVLLHSAALRPPIVGEVAQALAIEKDIVVDFLERAAHLGHLARVAKNRFFLPATMTDLIAIATALCSESGQGVFDAAAYRDRSGIGRNLTIEVLEFMDRMRITRYVNGRRRMV